jgi:hypothetical protein
VSDQSDINAAQNNRFPTICEGRQSSVQRGAVKDVKVRAGHSKDFSSMHLRREQQDLS